MLHLREKLRNEYKRRVVGREILGGEREPNWRVFVQRERGDNAWDWEGRSVHASGSKKYNRVFPLRGVKQ